MNKIKLILTVACLAFAGCVNTQFTSPTRETFKRSALFNKTSIGDLEWTVTGTNGASQRIVLKGYANDQVQAIQAAASGAVQGVIASQGGGLASPAPVTQGTNSIALPLQLPTAPAFQGHFVPTR